MSGEMPGSRDHETLTSILQSADEALAGGNCVVSPAAVSEYDTSRMGTGCPAPAGGASV